MKRKYLVCLLASIVLIQVGWLSNLNGVSVLTPEPPKLRIQLIVEHIRDGEIIDSRVKDGDLILENVAALWYNVFSGSDLSDFKSYKDIAGNVQGADNAITVLDDYGYVVIGTGTTAPTEDDYYIETIYGSVSYMSSSSQIIVDIDGNDINMTAIGYFACATDANITEVIVYTMYSVASNKQMTITRDTFSAIEVSSGDAIAVYVKVIIDQ